MCYASPRPGISVGRYVKMDEPPLDKASQSAGRGPLLRALRGANRYCSASVLVIEVPPSGAVPGGLAPPSFIARRLTEAGIGTPEAEAFQGPMPRAIEAVVGHLRQHLPNHEAWPEIAEPPADAAVVPLDFDLMMDAMAQLALAAVTGAPAAVLKQHYASILAAHESHYVSLNMKVIGDECRRRGLPWRKLAWSPRFHQIGEGRRRLWLDLSLTGKTSQLAARTGANKFVANRLLARAGIPVPVQIPALDVESAWRAARSIGGPVVVKPIQGNKARGITVGVSTPAEMEAAFKKAQEVNGAVLVERQIAGQDHRALVANGELIAIAKRMPPQVTGDGVSTVAELVARENARPQRSQDLKWTSLKTIEIDDELRRRLAQDGHSVDTVLPPGEKATLKFVGNLAVGATTIDVTDACHPKNEAMLIRATALVGLDIAGIDYITTDIGRPYDEVDGKICEVNSRVGLRAFLAAETCSERSVEARLLDAIYPKGSGAHPRGTRRLRSNGRGCPQRRPKYRSRRGPDGRGDRPGLDRRRRCASRRADAVTLACPPTADRGAERRDCRCGTRPRARAGRRSRSGTRRSGAVDAGQG